MSNAVVSRSTAEALDRVMKFFGIDEYNRDLFGIAARLAGTDAFCRTVEGLDQAIASDGRLCINKRIHARIAMEREIKRRENEGKRK